MGDVNRELAQIVSATNDLPPNILNVFMAGAVARRTQRHNSNNDSNVLLQITNQCNLPFNQICDIFGMLFKLIQDYTQNNPEQFHCNLLKMGFSEKFIEQFSSPLASILEPVGLDNGLVSVTWRIDISVVNKMAGKRPSVVMLKFTFKNYSFIVSLRSLDLLRNGIATILNEILKLKQSYLVKKRS